MPVGFDSIPVNPTWKPLLKGPRTNTKPAVWF